MTFELKLFAVSVYKNKLCFKFKNKLRAISCSTQQNFGEIFLFILLFLAKKGFCISVNFPVYNWMFIVQKVANLVSVLDTANLRSISQPQIPQNSNGWSATANPQVCGTFAVIFCTFASANDFLLLQTRPTNFAVNFSCFDKQRRPTAVINTSTLSSTYLLLCFCK